MPLDFNIKTDGGAFHFNISESLHSSIFSNSTRWSGFKQLRKIKDYYHTDCLFKDNDALSFINEFIEICESNSLGDSTIKEIKSLLSINKINYIRVSGD